MDDRIDRRSLVSATLGLAAVATLAVGADAATRVAIDTGDPRILMMILARLQGDVSGRIGYSYQRGQVYGLIGGQGLAIDHYGHRLFDYEGGSVARSRILPNGDVETRSRAWLFYTEPRTGEYLARWHNPITGDDIDVPPFRGGIGGSTLTPSGPKVNANFTMESSVFGVPTALDFVTVGDRTWISRHAFTRWTPKGTTIARTEITVDTWVASTRDMSNPRLTYIPSTSSWTSQTEWQSWLKMPPGQAGQQLWRADGTRVTTPAALPQRFLTHSQAEHPGILTSAIGWDS